VYETSSKPGGLNGKNADIVNGKGIWDMGWLVSHKNMSSNTIGKAQPIKRERTSGRSRFAECQASARTTISEEQFQDSFLGGSIRLLCVTCISSSMCWPSEWGKTWTLIRPTRLYRPIRKIAEKSAACRN